jgi:hypothetical protein
MFSPSGASSLGTSILKIILSHVNLSLVSNLVVTLMKSAELAKIPGDNSQQSPAAPSSVPAAFGSSSLRPSTAAPASSEADQPLRQPQIIRVLRNYMQLM